jgi:hypothetical protein
VTTLSALFPKSLVENIAFVFTNIPSPILWNFSIDTVPDVVEDPQFFFLDNPIHLQKTYLRLKNDPDKKKFRGIMRKSVLAGEDQAFKMLVKLFDWLDGLGPQPTTEITYLYDVSQSIEAMSTNTLAQMDQAATMNAEMDEVTVALKNNSKVSSSPCFCLEFNLILV